MWLHVWTHELMWVVLLLEEINLHHLSRSVSGGLACSRRGTLNERILSTHASLQGGAGMGFCSPLEEQHGRSYALSSGRALTFVGARRSAPVGELAKRLSSADGDSAASALRPASRWANDVMTLEVRYISKVDLNKSHILPHPPMSSDVLPRGK